MTTKEAPPTSCFIGHHVDDTKDPEGPRVFMIYAIKRSLLIELLFSYHRNSNLPFGRYYNWTRGNAKRRCNF